MSFGFRAAVGLFLKLVSEARVGWDILALAVRVTKFNCASKAFRIALRCDNGIFRRYLTVGKRAHGSPVTKLNNVQLRR